MTLNIDFFFWIICLGYFLGWILGGYSFFKNYQVYQKTAHYILIGVYVIHGIFLGALFLLPDFLSQSILTRVLVSIAFGSMGVYFFLVQKVNNRTLVTIFPLFAISAILLSGFLPIDLLISPAFSAYSFIFPFIIVIHILFIVLGYLCFAISFMMSIFFILQERRIKGKTFRLNQDGMPSLHWFRESNFKTISAGFIFLSFGLLIGISLGAFGEVFPPRVTLRLILPLITWLIYALIIFDVILRGLRGRYISVIAILGFYFALLSFIYEIYILQERI